MITKEQAEALKGHTTGPWEVGPDEENGSSKLSIHTADGYFVALIDHSTNEFCNANLITAAPDLRATVIALHERVERLEGALRPFAQEHSWGQKDRFEIVLASQYGSIAGADLDAACAILKETDHD